ncbi:hypothetical protein [Salipiger mucosus]|nr:hypothetical protein [Salipiger mucosus]
MRLQIISPLSDDQVALVAGHLVDEHRPALPQGCASETDVATRLREGEALAREDSDSAAGETWEQVLITDGIRFSRTHYFHVEEDGQRFTYDPDRRGFAIDDVPNSESVST